MTPEIIAIYLPQYYRTKYNDMWWGEGYTEWTACKNAKPLFYGHIQPRIPYEEYDLSDYHAIQKQAEMANKYGIDGFAIYQYYSLGNKLLNLPTETLLRHKEINIKYCLYWANESWESRWYGQEKKIIWEQKYGNVKDWKKHFEYCLSFFKDPRYIQIDGKPVYLVYKDWLFKDMDKFIKYWNHLAKENGFKGIYFIKTVAGHNTDALGSFDAEFEREPFYTLNQTLNIYERIYRYIRMRCIEVINKKLLIKNGKGIIQYKMDYSKCCKLIMDREPPNKDKTILGAFTDWDNSPRRQFNSTIFTGVSASKFGMCIKEQYKKAVKFNIPFIIINAWNEWGEGNYLEPDKYYGDGFLREIKKIKENVK